MIQTHLTENRYNRVTLLKQIEHDIVLQMISKRL